MSSSHETQPSKSGQTSDQTTFGKSLNGLRFGFNPGSFQDGQPEDEDIFRDFGGIMSSNSKAAESLKFRYRVDVPSKRDAGDTGASRTAETTNTENSSTFLKKGELDYSDLSIMPDRSGRNHETGTRSIVGREGTTIDSVGHRKK